MATSVHAAERVTELALHHREGRFDIAALVIMLQEFLTPKHEVVEHLSERPAQSRSAPQISVFHRENRTHCDAQPLLRIFKRGNSRRAHLPTNPAANANSRSFNILRATPCGSIFCRRASYLPTPNPRVLKYLPRCHKKKFNMHTPGRPLKPIVYNLHSIRDNEKDNIGTRRQHLRTPARKTETH